MKTILTLDSSQIDTFLTCPQYWQYCYKENLVPADLPTTKGKAMMMGTYGHKLLEIYYKAKSIGESQTNCIDQALAFDIDKETCKCGHSHEKHARTLEINNCDDCDCVQFQGEPFPLEKPDREQVRKRFREYSYIYTQNDLRPTSPDHVEVGFSHKLYEDETNVFVLEGRIDIASAVLNGQQVWVDHKFQLSRHDLYLKSIQFRNYSLVLKETTGEQYFGLVNYIGFAKEIKKDTISRAVISFGPGELEWWKNELIKQFARIAATIVTYQPNEMPKNWSACPGKYGYECDYTKLCNERNNDVKEVMKKNLYTIRKEWKPW